MCILVSIRYFHRFYSHACTAHTKNKKKSHETYRHVVKCNGYVEDVDVRR